MVTSKKISSDHLSWPSSIEQFLHYSNTVRQLSTHTLQAYRQELEKFAHYCQQARIDYPKDVNITLVRQWLTTLRRQGLAAKSMQRALSALRSFYRYYYQHNQQNKGHNPAASLQAPKGEHKLPQTLDTDAMQQLLDVPGDDWLGIRDRAILELFYSSGLRLSELVQLNLTDIDLAAALLTVTGKGRKTRCLPIGRYALKSLQQWLSYRNDKARLDVKALFISTRGTRLTARAIQARLKKYGQHIGQPLHPHMLRHACASHLLESSGDLRTLQEFLGHSSLSTTQIYTHLDFQHLAATYDRTHPRASKKSGHVTDKSRD